MASGEWILAVWIGAWLFLMIYTLWFFIPVCRFRFREKENFEKPVTICNNRAYTKEKAWRGRYPSVLITPSAMKALYRLTAWLLVSPLSMGSFIIFDNAALIAAISAFFKLTNFSICAVVTPKTRSKGD
jgi:hypothetical protein